MRLGLADQLLRSREANAVPRTVGAQMSQAGTGQSERHGLQAQE